MRNLTLKSCIHRVLPFLGKDLEQNRFSLAFFKRPALEATFKDGAGQHRRVMDWHLAKYQVFREDNDVQQKTSFLTGTERFLGHFDPRRSIDTMLDKKRRFSLRCLLGE
jgi:isopenicillin N synthase-like dioxygenase